MKLLDISEHGMLGRLARLSFRLLPSDAKMRILGGPLRGKRWIAGSSNHSCWIGSYEHTKQKAFAAVVQPGDVVYDLGANVGFYSLLASVLVGPKGRVLSFEPLAENLVFLRKHITLNQTTNWSAYEVAVGASDGTAPALSQVEHQ